MKITPLFIRWVAVGMTVALIFAARPSPARAESAAAATVTLYSTSGVGTPAQSITYGYQFRPLADLQVTAVGLMDLRTLGLQNDHPMGIWNASGTLLVSGTVPAGEVATLSGSFRYVTIAPTTV